MKKWRIVVGLLLNLLTIAAIGYGLSNQWLGYFGNGPKVDLLVMAHYYTNLANALLAVIMLICIIGDIAMLCGAKPSKFLAGLKLFGISGTTLTLAVVAGYLAPTTGEWQFLLFGLEFDIALHLVVPVLGILSYLVENKKALHWYACFLGVITPAIYGGFMIPAIHFNLTLVTPYEFLVWNGEQWWISVAWYAGMLLGSALLCLVLNLFRNIGNKPEPNGQLVRLFPCEEGNAEETKPEQGCTEECCSCVPGKGEEGECPEDDGVQALGEAETPKDLEAPEEETVEEQEKPAVEEDACPAVEEAPEEEPAPEVEPEPEPKPEPKPAPAPIPSPAPRSAPLAARPTPAKSDAPSRAYYITKQASTGKWQVRLGNSDRALRVFETQAEALAFTKGIVESRGGTYRVHSVKGNR